MPTPAEEQMTQVGQLLGGVTVLFTSSIYKLTILYILYRAMYALETISTTVIKLSSHG